MKFGSDSKEEEQSMRMFSRELAECSLSIPQHVTTMARHIRQ